MIPDVLKALLVYTLIDLVYLSFAVPRLYRPGFGDLMDPQPGGWKLAIGGLAWVALSAGLVYLVKPLLESKNLVSKWDTFIHGFLYGIVVYMVYNATTFAVLKNINPWMCVIDTVWGGMLSGAVVTILSQSS